MSSITVKQNLNPQQAIFAVLGNLCKDPSLLANKDVHLKEDDFVNNLHKIIFYAINNLISDNGTLKNITEFDIDTYLKNSDTYYKIWEHNQGIKYIRSSIEISNKDLFFENYHTIKKLSILRTYYNKGFNISDILDFETESVEDSNKLSKQQKEFYNLTENDLIEHFTKIALNTREELKENIDNGVKYFKGGDSLKDLVSRMNEAPEFGYPFANKFFNTSFNGMQKGKFLLISSTTGGGKTRRAVRDLLNVSCSEMVDSISFKWEKLAAPRPSLFISTELEKEELQQQMLSFITKIPPQIILSGNYNTKIAEKINKAIDILEKAPIYFIEMEDFDINDVKTEIERYILNYGVEYIAFDYIQMSPKLSAMLQREFGHSMKDDQILIELSRTLKNIAKEHNVFIQSATQLNASEFNQSNSESKTQNALRGAKGIADKIDYGVIAAPPTEKDLKKIQNTIDVNKEPNMSYWIYKNRNNAKNIVVWSKINLGTMKEEFLFCTNYNYDVIDMKPTDIQVEDDKFTVANKIEV